MLYTGHSKTLQASLGWHVSLNVEGPALQEEIGKTLCLIKFTPLSRHLWFLELVLPNWILLLTLGTADMEKDHCGALISDIHLFLVGVH